jgi:RNA polymerase sigma-70 factor (ECF subfamily)
MTSVIPPAGVRCALVPRAKGAAAGSTAQIGLSIVNPSMTTTDPVQLMLSGQGRLYAFIMSLLGDPDQASDVLQQTNLVMWEKIDNFQPGTNFMAWAFRIARFQVMAHRQKHGRDRHVFDDEAIGLVADAFEKQAEDFDDRLDALSRCIQQLPDDRRRLLRRRYGEGWSVKNLAEELGQTANQLAVRLHRLREVLMQCIQRHCAEAELS